MREIKFRGWERELQMMVYDTELGGWIFEYDGNPVRAVNQMINEEDYFYDLMQYTGLKDKNGVEIYEGDVVKGSYYAGYNIGIKRIIGNVSWTSASFKVTGIKQYEGIRVGFDGSFEVIGNIYENPELLERK